MNPLLRHIVLPCCVPAAFFLVALSPIHLLGCRNRGLLALAIAFASVLAGLYTAVRAGNLRRRNDPAAQWWLATTLILVIAPIALLILA
ncbi:MAG: hypothetical protein FDZ69_13340 [Deltaproteobacteria bacterium]|nr:MAG: hypothetical protein FDZ69_13340 [Deltaproteobacteria bacterium]